MVHFAVVGSSEFIAFCPLQWQEYKAISATAMKLLRFDKQVLSLVSKDHRGLGYLHISKQFSKLERDF
jgi:hypothetical protein